MTTTLPTAIRLNRLDASLVRKTATIVDTSGVVDMISQWRVDDGFDKSKGGRPRIVSDRTAIILMLVLGIQSSALHVTRARDILCHQTTQNAWEELELPAHEFDTREEHLDTQRWYNRVWHAVHRVMDVMDPYPELNHWKRLEKSEYEALRASRDRELILKRKARATVFSNALITASVATFGEDRLKTWNGDVVTDATPLEVTKKGLYNRSRRMPSTPEAGWYQRNHADHRSNPSSPKKVLWGFDLTMTSMTGPTFGGEGKFPSLVVGMSLDRPGVRVAENALKSLDHIIQDESLPKGNFVGDRAYFPMAKADDLQVPLRASGYKMVGDFPKDVSGVTDGYEGAVQVDGAWYCPAILKHKSFVNPRQDLADKKITYAQFQKILEQRQDLALTLKENRKDGSQRFECPARGKYPKVLCPLVSTRRDERKNPKSLRPLFDHQVPKKNERGCVCTQKSLSIPVTVGAKYALQGPVWGSQEWKDAFLPARNIIESRNDKLKNARGVGVGNSTSRMIRGFIGQLLLAAVGVVSLNVQLIQGWLKSQEKKSGPKGPGGRPRTPDLKPQSLRDVADSHAPPVAA